MFREKPDISSYEHLACQFNYTVFMFVYSTMVINEYN